MQLVNGQGKYIIPRQNIHPNRITYVIAIQGASLPESIHYTHNVKAQLFDRLLNTMHHEGMCSGHL